MNREPCYICNMPTYNLCLDCGRWFCGKHLWSHLCPHPSPKETPDDA
jgi:hypothetical protein